MKYVLAIAFSLPGYAAIALSIYVAYGAALEFVARDRVDFVLATLFAYLIFSVGWGWNKGVTRSLGLEPKGWRGER